MTAIHEHPNRFSAETPWHMRGNYAPIDDEATIESLPVKGKIPAELNGSYLRNGFNPAGRVPAHWFFGAGMVHGFDIADGKVAYRNRYVHTPYVDQDMDMMEGIGDLTLSPANTSIIKHAGRILALEEAHFPWEMDIKLNTLGCVDFDGRLKTPMTAHPKISQKTGEMFFFGYQFLNEPFLTYHRTDAVGTLVQSEIIEIPRPVMMHDFAITENYALFFDLPIVFSMEKGGFRFQRDLGGRIGVMPLTGSNADVRWFEVEACTVFHSINAYEQGDEIILQVCRASSIMEHGMNDIGDQSSPWQWNLNLKTGKATETQLDDRTGDFPRIDDRLIGLPSRFGYIAGLMEGSSPGFLGEIYKYDMKTGGVETHSFGGDEASAFEPIFVPATPDAGEDEGWIICLSHDDSNDETTLNIIEAQNFEAEAVAQVVLPRRIPFGAHGSWIASE